MIEIYTKDNCVYCSQAKLLMTTNGLQYTEHMLGIDFTREMLKENFPTATSFPVVVIDGFYVGGYNQLLEHVNSRSSAKLLNE